MAELGHILAIEISNPSAAGDGPSGPGVAIARLEPAGVRVLDVERVRASGFGARSGGGGPSAFGGHDDDLMPAIDRLVRRMGIRMREELAAVAVSAGPGGYTSLRVGCAVGKMIAAGARNGQQPAQCASVPTSLVVLESVPAELRTGRVAVALASKADSAWVDCFAAGASLGPGVLMTAADVPHLVELEVATLVADRFLPAQMRTSIASAGISIIEPTFDAAACARVGARLPRIAPSELVPIYPREPDAVTLWRTRHPQP